LSGSFFYQVRQVCGKLGNSFLRLLQIISLEVFFYLFFIDKAFLFQILSEPSLFLLIRNQNSCPAGLMKIVLQSVKSCGKIRDYFCLTSSVFVTD